MSDLLIPLAFIDLSKGLLAVVLGVGALIFFHELGHFLAAKAFGVRVLTFSLGFGRRLAGFRRGETDYRLSLLPLGGYVRMLGQADDDPDEPRTELPDDFRNKPPWQRFVILVAGVVMNIVLAAVGFIAAFGLGVEFTAAEVGSVTPGSPAARAGLRAGDMVLAIDGEEVLGFQDLQTLIAVSRGEVEVEVLRDGQRVTLRARPVRGPSDSYARLGVAAGTVVAALDSRSPLAAAGVLPATPAQSERILSVSPVDSRVDASRRMSDLELLGAIEAAPGPVVAVIERTRHDEDGRPIERARREVTVETIRRPEYTLGLQVPDQVWVRGLTEGGAAELAGVQVGDRLLALGDRTDLTHGGLRDVIQDVGARLGEVPIRLVVERNAPGKPAETKELQVTLAVQNPEILAAATDGVSDPARRLELRKEVGLWMLGVDYRADVVGAASTLPLAEEGGAPIELQPGDRLTRVWLTGGLWWSNEQPFLSLGTIMRLLRERPEEQVKLAWLPGGDETQEEKSAVVRPARVEGKTWGDLGFKLTERPVAIQRGPIAAVALGLDQTLIQTQRILLMLRSFVTGSVSPRELGGPIMIANVAYTVATQDSFAKLLHLLAILSVNLAVINILPIPVLDGGHILFLLIEKLKGRPVSGQVMASAQWVGLFLILGLMALVFFNDIRRLVQNL